MLTADVNNLCCKQLTFCWSSSSLVQVAELFFQRTKLLKWLLGRVRQREFDSNKQYASEVLAILLQSSPVNQQILVDADGIELLLQVGCHPGITIATP